MCDTRIGDARLPVADRPGPLDPLEREPITDAGEVRKERIEADLPGDGRCDLN
ncbi:hypothetical protein [Micromonospora sediminicola]|uniref:hypothetical protein n=1 Tax=Micromonospora sediminicola TaxID=946078 RepID=UPI0033D80077